MKERATLLLSFTLLTGLAAGSYWLSEQARQINSAPRKAAHEADYYVERFALTSMDQQGSAFYTIKADKMTHFADDDSSLLEQPRIRSLRADQPPTDIRANVGRLTSEGVEVHLMGDVQLHRAAFEKNPEITMRSPYLLVLPEEEIARTHTVIEMTQGSSRITGQGFEFNNGQRVVQLNPKANASVRVHVQIAPKN